MAISWWPDGTLAVDQVESMHHLPSRRVVSVWSLPKAFYRNAINIGLPILECEEAADQIQAGDEVTVDFNTGVIKDLTQNREWQAQPFPPFIQNIIDKGGLMASLKEK